MRKIGILGGMGWPSTMHYYRCICTASQTFHADRGLREPLPIPEITIESVDIHAVRALRPGEGEHSNWDAYEAHLREGFRRLEAAGCDFGLMATNTPHQRLAGIREGVKLPIVSILEATARAVQGLGCSRAVLLGTSKTMQGPAYPEALGELGIGCVTRTDDGFVSMMDVLIDTELIAGATDGAREKLLAAARELGGDDPDTAVLLACTELPLAFPNHLFDETFEVDGMRLVNTTTVHAMAAFRRAVADA